MNAFAEYARRSNNSDFAPTPTWNDAVEIVENLPYAHPEQRWIPCSERMPENSRTVLVTDWGITGFGRRFDGRWWDCDGNVLKDVSAWMPLPEPYKKDGEQNG